HLALSGPHIKGFNSRGVIAVAGKNREITRDDVRRAIDAAKAVPPSIGLAHKAAAWSYSVLAVAAAARGDASAALAVLADEQHVVPPARCVLGLAIEDRRRAIVARDAAGNATVHHDEARQTPAIDPRALVPPEVAAGFAGCPVVEVIARPPIHGMARLLPDAIAWGYLSQRARPADRSGDEPGVRAGERSGHRSVVVADVEPPAALELPRLATWSSTAARASSSAATTLSGPQATPSRVLAAIGSADDVVIHAHGIVDLALPDASFLALSPEPDGRFALTTADVRKARFTARPLVVLAACRASQAAPVWHETWSLPAAFVYAGARAVIASAAPIPDAGAAAFFDDVRARVRGGAPVAVAVRDARQVWLAARRGDWVRDVIVFE
ncbi:MAG TPA: CHAT domain-containing protein, partial [Kofleriaceae bacterium]|nr:CHAT domain-containing protein [Kofleriaceae bacterium]